MFGSVRPLLSSFATQAVQRNVLTEQVRTNVRWYFEKCSELKRIRTYGYKKRIADDKGKKIIMRRILRGRHNLTH